MGRSLPEQGSIILLCVVPPYFLAWSAFALMCPFFQTYAARTCGASEVTVGLVFAALPVASCLASFPVSKMIANFGCSTCLTGGLLLLAVSVAAFGMSRTIASWLCWRIVQGVASTAVLNSITNTVTIAFTEPGDFTFANAVLEVVSGSAYTLSPLAAGSLFEMGGFPLPFSVAAVLLAVFACMEIWHVLLRKHRHVEAPAQKQPLIDGSASLSPSSEHAFVKQIGILDVCTGKTLCMAGVGTVTMGCYGALEVMFAAHFRATLGVSSDAVIGALVALPCIPYVVGSVLAPCVSRRMGDICTVLVGLALFALGCLGFGFPTPEQAPAWLLIYGFEQGALMVWVLQVSTLLFLGLGFSMSWTMLLPSMLNEALASITACEQWQPLQQPREIMVKAVSPAVVALFNSAGSIGKAAGPAFGGGLIEVLGFSKTSAIFGIAALSWGCLLAHISRQKFHKLRSSLRSSKSDHQEFCAEQA
jgi:MFS family permease